MIGKILSHYRILSKLGEGGMGTVYRAEDTSLGRQVALKVLSPQLVADPKARRRFLHEAKAAAALDHPGICMVYEAGEAESQLFIAMALLEGETLKDRIASGPLSIDASLDIATQVAVALKQAHSKGIVHRDIKPANIMLLPSGQAKVMDFGLARLEGATQLTRTGATLGTSAYMSPEQTRGDRADERSDLWSLGVVLYEMVTGRVPFRGEYEPAVEYAILHEEPEPLGTARAGTPPELEKLVGRCLKKNPAERCQSADELLEDLERLKSKPASARKSMPSRPAPSRPTTLPGTSATAVQILGDRYRIERLLGRGGMGEVWLAFDLKLRVEVALKFLLPEVSADPQRIELLRREVRTARNVASPHVCRVFDLIEIEGQELVSMEYVDGTTLQELLAAQSPLDIVEARRIATQLLTGLQDIHNAGLIHRDLKPANVMITRSGRAVVMDFGLAKGVADTQKTVAVAGTPAYMAPEQMRGEELDARADLYAVGMILAEMVAPEGVRDNVLRRKLWDGLRQDPPKAPPGAWEAAIRRAIAANKGERFASAAEMARALGDGAQRLSGIEEVSPYPGLSAFTGEQTRFFFGRELDVESIWKKLNRLSMAALIGPSGVGKSSFLRAGVMAAKPEGWNVVICTPGDAPFTSLGQSLLADFAGQEDARDLFRLSDIDRSIPLLNKWRQCSKKALLVVDQFEELFTLNPPEVQSRFAELLGRLSVEADIHVLVSMRDDFFFLCNQYPALSPLFAYATPLGPLSVKDLRRAIVEPARLCGFAFEDDALVDEMMADVEGERGALPLVAFAAARLWDLRDREHGIITRHSFEEIGKVGGALAQHAEATLERIGHEREDVVREIFRNLVTAQHTRVVREREELLSVFEDRAKAEEVLKTLIDARLLTSFEVPEGKEGSNPLRRIEVVHESLLTSWPRLVRWQTQDTDGAQLRDQLRQAAQLWKEKSESDDLLWTGTAYREFELWRERYPGGLTETEEAFGEAMGARAVRDRRRRRVALGAAFAVLVAVIAIIAYYASGLKVARLESEAGKLVALGRAELEEDPSVALAYAGAALELADNPSNRLFALEALARGPAAWILPLSGEFQLISMRFSPNGSRMVAGGTTGVQILSGDGTPPIVLDDRPTFSDRSPEFAPDNDRVIWRDVEDPSIIHIWSMKAGKEIRTFDLEAFTIPVSTKERLILLTAMSDTPQPGTWTYILRTWSYDERDPEIVGRWSSTNVGWFYPDLSGRSIAYTLGGENRGVYYGSLEDFFGFRGRLIGEHDLVPYHPIFDDAGERVATTDSSGEIRIWSVTGHARKPLRVLRADPPIASMRFNPSGTMLAVICSPEKIVKLWDLEGPLDAEPLVFRHKGNRFGANIAFDPTGRWLFVGHSDEIAIYPAVPPDPYTFSGMQIQGSNFTADSRFMIGVSPSAKKLRFWSLYGEPTRHLFTDTEFIGICSMDPSGEMVAVGAMDGLFIVSMADGSVRKLSKEAASVMPIDWSPDGRSVAGYIWMAGGRAELRIWDVETGAARTLEEAENTNGMQAMFSDDGSLFTASGEGVIKRWNLRDSSSVVVARGSLPQVWFLSISRNGRYLLADFTQKGIPMLPTGRSELKLFDLQNGIEKVITWGGHNVVGAILDAEGKRMAIRDYDGVIRIGPTSGEEPHVLFGTPGIGMGGLAISPDGRWIAADKNPFSMGSDAIVKLWRMPEGRPIQTLPHEEFLAYLRAQTNLRVVPDKISNTGYRVDTEPFPGWEKLPTR